MDDVAPKSNAQNTRNVMIFVLIFLSLVAFCGYTLWAIIGILDHSPADERIIAFHEAVLSAASAHPNDPRPEEFRYDVLVDCWEFLQAAIQTHGSEYTLTLGGIWGDEGTPIGAGTGATESIVYVDFADGTRLSLQSYAYTLETCQEVADAG